MSSNVEDGVEVCKRMSSLSRKAVDPDRFFALTLLRNRGKLDSVVDESKGLGILQEFGGVGVFSEGLR